MGDRLIELLNQINFDYCEECVCASEDGYKGAPDLAEFFADRLLAEGVIVPRFKKGDKIYYISAVGNIIENKVYYVGGYARGLCYNADNKPLLDNVFLDTRVNEEYYFTREEAERALERSENGT